MYQKPELRPLQVSIERHQSDAMLFSINPLAPANGKIYAIRVQDIARQIWFNWDRGVGWTRDTTPITEADIYVTVGIDTLYIAAYAVNEGGGGDLTLQMKADTETIAQKTEYVASGAGLGVETGTIPMPNRTYDVWIGVAP